MTVAMTKMRRIGLKTVLNQKEFVPWLLENENLKALGETIGIELDVQILGDWKDPALPDVMCKNQTPPNKGSWVLLESQFDTTSDEFMGKVLNYASVMNTPTVIWIAEKFSNEHKLIMDWLNDIGENKTSFFALEVELWSIGSDIASKFNIISRPKRWQAPEIQITPGMKPKRKYSKRNLQQIGTGKPRELRDENGLTPQKQRYLKFWSAFKLYLEKLDGSFQMNSPLPQAYTALSIGRTGIIFRVAISESKRKLQIDLNFWKKEAQPFYFVLNIEKDQIHKELGYELFWDEMEGFGGSKISLEKLEQNVEDESTWLDQFEWLDNKVQDFIRVLKPRLRDINPDEWINKIES